MAKMRLKRGFKVQRVIYKIVSTVIVLWVGGEVIEAVDDNMNLSNNVFQDGFDFLGLDGSETAGVPTTGILGVIGLVAAASIILEFVEYSL